MTAPPSGRRSWLAALMVSCLGVLFVWIAGHEWVEILQSGILPGRRGPALSAADHPVAFWAVMVFIGGGVLLCAGLVFVCVLTAARGVVEEFRRCLKR